MPRSLPFLIFALATRTLFACRCEATFSACNETGMSNLVFIGTVESIEPTFLSRWDESGKSSLRSFNEALANAQERPSDAKLALLKQTLLKILPTLDADRKRQLEVARTAVEVAALFNSGLNRGMRVHFKVRTLFKHEDDNDNPSAKAAKPDEDGDDDEKSFEIWTSFGDCGYDFQVGETYLVYAGSDEASNTFFTDKCSRTRRVSDAGEDLGYLFYYKDQREESARLEGFATTDSRTQLDFGHLPEAIASPVVGAFMSLQSSRLKRFVQTDKNGRFVFDGLPEGDYTMSVFGSDYPSIMKPLAAPYSIQVPKSGCSRQLVVLPGKSK